MAARAPGQAARDLLARGARTLDAAVAVTQIARALRPGGWLAAWWTVFGDTSRPTPFRERLVPMLDERLPGPPESHLTSGVWFTHVETEQLRWSASFNPTAKRS